MIFKKTGISMKYLQHSLVVLHLQFLKWRDGVFFCLIIYNFKSILTSEAQMLRTDVVKNTLYRDANSDRVPAQSLFRQQHRRL